MAQQRLRGKPSLTPRSSALLPVPPPEGNTLRGQHPNRLSTRNDGQVQNSHNQQQLIAPSRQRTVQTTSDYLHWCGADPPSSLSMPAPAWPCPPETRSFFCHFGGVLGVLLSVLAACICVSLVNGYQAHSMSLCHSAQGAGWLERVQEHCACLPN